MLSHEQAFAMMPPDQITINNAEVVSLEEWTLIDKQPKLTLYIQRKDEGFLAKLSDTIAKSDQISGPLETVTLILPTNLRAKYIQLFQLLNPTVEEITSLGFDKYEIIED